MYTKILIDDGLSKREVDIDLTGKNIYTKCPECGKEIRVDPIEWAHDFSDFSWEDHPICEECTNKRLMKEGQA